MRIQRVQIEGYRTLQKVDLPLRNLNVLIGPNGSGKSTFLDAFSLLSEAMSGGLTKGIVGRGGLHRMVTLESASSLVMRIHSEPIPWPETSMEIFRGIAAAGSPVEYELKLSLSGSGYSIEQERLTQFRAQPKPFIYLQRTPGHVRFYDPKAGGLKEPDWDFQPEELALAQVPRTYADAAAFRSSLANIKSYAPILLDLRSPLRLPQTLQPNVKFPSPTGEDLISALYRLRSEQGQIYEQLTDTLEAAFPGFAKLEFPLVAGGQAALAWYASNVQGPLYASELSAGTLRFIHLAAMLLSPDLNPLMVLDEPEISFHPELLRLLAELLVQASESTQLIVATHSAPLIRWLKPEHVIVVDRTEQGSILTRGDALDLDHWLESYSLDQLWQMNVLGAQP